jgi:hypothetical protein
MGTTPAIDFQNESNPPHSFTRQTRTAGALLLILTMALVGCTSAQPETPTGEGGTGGKTGASGGKGGGTGGKGGGTSATGGASGGAAGSVAGMGGEGGGAAGGADGSGGQAGMDASTPPTGDGSAPQDSRDVASGTTEDGPSAPPADAPPALMRPDAMGQACKSAANEAFTVTAFDQPRTGIFTAWFSATPSIAPSNSVVGLSDGDVGPGSGNTPLHNLHQILIRFGASGALDARNGTTYAADSVIKYQAIQYDFRLVVDLPNKRYSAYVSSNGQPEITIGTNFAYRDSAAVPTKFDHWAVQAVSAKTTVCGFITRAN